MAVDFLSAFGGQLAGTVSDALLHPAVTLISAAYAPSDYNVRRNLWSRDPHIMPGLGETWNAFNRGLIDDATARSFTIKLGLPWRLSDESRNSLIQIHAGNPDYDDFITNLGDAWEKVRLASLQYPDISTIVRMYHRGYIDRGQFEGMAERAGSNANYWVNVLDSMNQPVDVDVLRNARNRGIIDDEHYDVGLQRLGYKKPFARYVLDSLREVIPPINDLIMFGVRDVWDSNAAESRKLFEDTPPQLAQWASKQGLFGDSGIIATINGVQRVATWPEVYWAAHWQPLPLNQAQQAFHRLRPGRADRFANLQEPPDQFTEADLVSALKIADYPVGDRATLVAMAYQPIGRREINRAISLRAKLDKEPGFAASLDPQLLADLAEVSVDWAIQAYRDLGLTDKDATDVVNASYALVQTAKQKSLDRFDASQLTKRINAIIESYKQGSVSRNNANHLMAATGVKPESAASMLDIVDVEIQTGIVKAAVAGIRRDYLNGVLAEPELRQALFDAGVQEGRAADTVAKWQLLHNHTRRTATTEKLLKWLETGLISNAEAITRLTNLGWTQADQLTLLREAQLQIAKLQAQRNQAAVRNRRQAAKQLESVQKQAAAQGQKARASLQKAMPRTSILSWLRKGLVSPAFANARLLAQGYPQASIDLWLREATLGKQPATQGGPAPQTETGISSGTRAATGLPRNTAPNVP